MTDEADRAAKRANVLRLVSDGMRAQREALEVQNLLSSFDQFDRENTARITASLGIPVSYLGRTFVCQGCGRVATVLHGASMKCGCGVTSSAELLT